MCIKSMSSYKIDPFPEDFYILWSNTWRNFHNDAVPTSLKTETHFFFY